MEMKMRGWALMLWCIGIPGDWFLTWRGSQLLWAGEPIDPNERYAVTTDANGDVVGLELAQPRGWSCV